MKDVKRQLVEGDPIVREAGLDARDAQAIRQRMLVESRTRPASTPRVWWTTPVVVAGAVAACVMLAIGLGMRIDGGDSMPAPAVQPASPRDRISTQLQFATTGGTRIIWTFHERFDL